MQTDNTKLLPNQSNFFFYQTKNHKRNCTRCFCGCRVDNFHVLLCKWLLWLYSLQLPCPAAQFFSDAQVFCLLITQVFGGRVIKSMRLQWSLSPHNKFHDNKIKELLMVSHMISTWYWKPLVTHKSMIQGFYVLGSMINNCSAQTQL